VLLGFAGDDKCFGGIGDLYGGSGKDTMNPCMSESSRLRRESAGVLSRFALLMALVAGAVGCGKRAPADAGPSDGGAAGALTSGGSSTLGGSPASGGTAAVPCARSHCPEVLYDRRPNLVMRGVALDQHDVYWFESANEGNIVKAAPKGGSGPIRTLGRWWDFEVDAALVVDETHAYWMRPEGTGTVLKVNKDGSASVTLPLPGADAGTRLDLGPIIDAGEALLIATHGCTTIIRVAKDGSGATTWPVSKDRNAGGETDLERDGDQVYCSNGKYVHLLNTNTGEASVVTDALSFAGPLKKLGDSIYVANNRPVTNSGENLARINPDHTITDLGPALGYVDSIVYDEPCKVFHWVTGLSLANAEVVAFHLDRTDPPQLLFDQQSMESSVVADADYIYWGADQAMMRLKKE
jgi:hypothetical protein